MKQFIVNLIKLILSISILIFTEDYFYKFLDLINININNNSFVSLIIYILIFICICIIYKDEITSAYSKYQHKLANNIFYSILTFIILFIGMMIINYLVIALSKGFNITYEGLNFINIFNYKFNFNLIVTIIKDILIIPFIKVIIFVLGINNMVGRKTGNFISGLLYSIYKIYLICHFNSSIGYILINAIPYFCLFSMLSYIYKKNNNIMHSIICYILYELFASTLIIKFL